MGATTAAHVSWAPAPRHPRDERSPHATSRANAIPGVRPAFPIPTILRNKDKGPGRVHHHLENVTDYYPRDRYPSCQQSLLTWQEQRIAKAEAFITSNVAPKNGRVWVGLQRDEHVYVPRPPVAVKEISIVPEYLPPGQNNLEIRQNRWQVAMLKRARAVVRDSGYHSEGRRDGKAVCVGTV